MCGSWLLHIMLLKVIYAFCLTNIVIQFRALADQFYRSPEHHEFVRQEIVNQVDCFFFFILFGISFFFFFTMTLVFTGITICGLAFCCLIGAIS